MSQPASFCADPTELCWQPSKAPQADLEPTGPVAGLDERLRFESLLAQLSTKFINLPVEEIVCQIEHGLQQIVEFLHIERSSLSQFSQDRDLVNSLQLASEVFANALGRKRADMALRASEGRFRLMAESAPVMVWMSGPDKLCTYFNKHWLDFAGQPLERQIGNGWSEGIHADDFERCLDTYGRAFDARQEFRMEYRLRRFDGEYRWLLDTGVPRFESDGTFEGYIGSCIDITDQKQVEEESRSLREQLIRVGRVTSMGELAASIAHEVNQPLCAIVSNANALQRMLASGHMDLGELREALGDISDDGQRASAVIARIRGFFQKTAAQRAPVDVNDLIREVAGLLRSEMARRGVTVKLELARAVPAVLGDRVQLEQVILNLMGNAADAMDHVTRDLHELVLSSGVDETGNVAVAVKDAGAGIEANNRERIFEAFFTTKPGGTGMGLSICKTIVQAHGGRIGAGANSDWGTTVEFTLPAIREGVPCPTQGPLCS
jgi:PAS domain S-box-containing protein